MWFFFRSLYSLLVLLAFVVQLQIDIVNEVSRAFNAVKLSQARKLFIDWLFFKGLLLLKVAYNLVLILCIVLCLENSVIDFVFALSSFPPLTLTHEFELFLILA